MMDTKLLLVPTAAVALALSAGSIAYGCAAIDGALSVTFGNNTAACTSDDIPQSNVSGDCALDVSASRKMVATLIGGFPNKTFFLWFLNDAVSDQELDGICQSKVLAKHPHTKTAANSDGTGIGSSVTSDINGDIAATTRYIPSTIKHGVLWPEQDLLHTGTHNATASVCFIDEAHDFFSQDVTVLITGGSGNP